MVSIKDCELVDWKTFCCTESSEPVVDILELACLSDESWIPLFDRLLLDSRIEGITKRLTDIIPKEKVFPHPMLVFRAFWASLDDIKVVILGQDPYFGSSNGIPQAMGLSFSVPRDFKIPPSLVNIYENLIRFGHLRRCPKTGDLTPLVDQGVFLLNTALTVSENKPNSHTFIWKWFTDEIIRYINVSRPDIKFVLWGGNAISKFDLLIPGTLVIMSSHPSPLGVSKSCKGHPAFVDTDFAKDLGVDWNVLI